MVIYQGSHTRVPYLSVDRHHCRHCLFCFPRQSMVGLGSCVCVNRLNWGTGLFVSPFDLQKAVILTIVSSSTEIERATPKFVVSLALACCCRLLVLGSFDCAQIFWTAHTHTHSNEKTNGNAQKHITRSTKGTSHDATRTTRTTEAPNQGKRKIEFVPRANEGSVLGED